MNLEFVGAEEAAKWPEGCRVLLAREGTGPFFAENYFSPTAIDIYTRKWSRFARLPDTLPELEGKDG